MTLPFAGRYAPGGVAPDRLLPPGIVLNGRYRVVRLLGAGSFGRVYLAEDTADPLRPEAAIKELLDTQFRNGEERAEAVAWFRREVSTLLSLQHPAIPAVHGYWTAQRAAGPLYLAMDYVPGRTLDEVLGEGETRVPWRQVVNWGIALCDVLAYLHGRTPPFVFRDLKLSNVMLDSRTGSPVLIDFGIARQLTAAGGTVIGTWGYVPFEQVLGRAEPRSDLYALGALLHALLTGRRPDEEYVRLQRGGCDVEAAMRALFPPADTLVPDVPAALARAITRATAYAPADRFPDATAMAAALRRALESPLEERATGAARWIEACPEGAGPRMENRTSVMVPAAPACLTVCAQGTGQFRTISAAIRHARPGMRIEVQPGLYAEGLVLDKQVEVVGVGPVDAVIVETGNAPCLTMHAKSATVRGLTLRGGPQQGRKGFHVVDIPKGRLLLEDCHITSGVLACIAVHGPATDPLIRRCAIRHAREAGVLIYDDAQGTLEECEINSNTVGIAIRHYACPTVRRCSIRDGVAHGIHVMDYAEGAIEDCEISGNGHAGVCIDRGSMLTIRHSRINRNQRGIAVAADGGGTVERCDLSANFLGAWSIASGAEPLLHRVDNRARG